MNRKDDLNHLLSDLLSEEIPAIDHIDGLNKQIKRQNFLYTAKIALLSTFPILLFVLYLLAGFESNDIKLTKKYSLEIVINEPMNINSITNKPNPTLIIKEENKSYQTIDDMELAEFLSLLGGGFYYAKDEQIPWLENEQNSIQDNRLVY